MSRKETPLSNPRLDKEVPDMPPKLVSAHRLAAALPAALLTFAVLPALAQKPFAVQDQWTIGGEGGWDYLLADPSAHRLYITHGTRVEVVDTATGKSVGAITGLKGTHGVALDADGKLRLHLRRRRQRRRRLRPQDARHRRLHPAGTNPDGITFEPVTKTVWAFNGGSKDATVIDTKTRKVVATIPLPGKPEFPQPDGTGLVFDNIEDKNEIVRLDAHSLKLTATWPLDGLESPSGLAIDRAGKRLFAVCDGKKMAVVDYMTGKVIAKPDIGDGPDAAGYDPSPSWPFPPTAKAPSASSTTPA
jgi:YVTN family beta-propeller protein